MIREKNVLLGFGVAAVLLLGSMSVAEAQYGAPPPGYSYPPPPPPPSPRGMYRGGLTLGASLGVGGISAQNCGDACGFAGGLELHIGGMINPRFALMGDLWFNGHAIPNSDADTVHTIYTIAAQYWATDQFWLRGGIGGARMEITSNFDGYSYGSESGLGLMGGGGFEVVQSGNMAIDLQLLLGHGFYDIGGDVNSVAFLIGFNWY